MWADPEGRMRPSAGRRMRRPEQQTERRMRRPEKQTERL
jgi:hypothetical protein